ncbi:type II secretion system F family protein [Nitrospira sp. Nam80]
MAVFLYKAVRADGTALEGRIEGETEGIVRSQLDGQGLCVFRLSPERSGLNLPLKRLQQRQKNALRDFLVFNQELLVLIKAGLPILKIWDLLIERMPNRAFQATLRAVQYDIRGGASISDALARHPHHFPEIYIASILAGEQSGTLPDVLKRYITYLKLMIGLRQKMTKAMAYPGFLVMVGIAVLAFLLTYVMPTFKDVYEESGAELPTATQALLTGVDILEEHAVSFALGLFVLSAAVRLWLRTPIGRLTRDRLLLKLPLIGEILIRHYTVQFSHTLATVLASGAPLLNALRIVQQAMSNRILAAGVGAAIDQVQQGSKLAAALTHGKVLPRIAIEMVSVGEETGALDVMLRELAEFQEDEMDQQLNLLTTWIEPVLLLVMGVLVGGVVIVMYLPIFQMAGKVH